MDDNEYRTHLIVKAYEFAEKIPSICITSENWSLTTNNGDFELKHGNILILSVTNKSTNLDSNVSRSNQLPYFVEQWLINQGSLH
ncbi:hypothetical protein ACOMCU_22400 [Lysinibacillus sp. UGB7]|uniref:hypothetical protein n=1 Tax=Lysinibacillus sp. UGB7 TaxID=3411039 RepID=UPI003B823BF9